MEVDRVCGHRNHCPGFEELRMVRAIVGTALMEAFRQGVYHAVFHGFCIHAVRLTAERGFCISVEVDFDGTPCERVEFITPLLPGDHDVHPAVLRRERFDIRLVEPIALTQVM
jgi:hypothetical protein